MAVARPAADHPPSGPFRGGVGSFLADTRSASRRYADSWTRCSTNCTRGDTLVVWKPYTSARCAQISHCEALGRKRARRIVPRGAAGLLVAGPHVPSEGCGQGRHVVG